MQTLALLMMSGMPGLAYCWLGAIWREPVLVNDAPRSTPSARKMRAAECTTLIYHSINIADHETCFTQEGIEDYTAAGQFISSEAHTITWN